MAWTSPKTNWTAADGLAAADVNRIEENTKQLANNMFIQNAGGTATAITLENIVLTPGFVVTFIVGSNNNSAATTINGKNLYKPGGAVAPNLKAGRAVTVWYNGTNFFMGASAGEGNAAVGDVLAGKTFTNDDDSGLVGTIPIRANNTEAPMAYWPPNTNGNANAKVHMQPPEGYYDGQGWVSGDQPDLIPQNFLNTKNIFGVQGGIINRSVEDHHQPASAIAVSDAAGYGAYMAPPEGYYSGASWVRSLQPDLVAGNIRKDKNIFGVVGSLNPSEMIYNFPLSIQDTQPTAIRSGHIWVKITSLPPQIERVYIIDVPRVTDQDNTLYLAVGNKASMNLNYSTSKALQSGGSLWFSDYSYLDTEATWEVSKNTNGITQFIAYRKPVVYSKLNGVLDIETAYMWNGSAWVLLSQKGQYLISHSANSFKSFNVTGQTTTLAQSLATTGSTTQYSDVSNDGTYYHNTYMVYKRNGDVFSTYSELSSQVVGGVNVGPVYVSCLSGDGLCLFDVKNILIGGFYKIYLCKYINNGSTFVLSSYHEVSSATSTYSPVSVTSDYTGATVSVAYAIDSTPQIRLAILFKGSGETYTCINHITSLYSGVTSFYGTVKMFLMSGRLIALGAQDSGFTYLRLMSFTVNKVLKSVTYENTVTGSATFSNWSTLYQTVTRAGNNHLLLYNSAASPYLKLINVLNLNESNSVVLSGYSIPGSEIAGSGISSNLNRNMVVLTPNALTYGLKFSLSISGTTATLTYIEQIPNFKATYNSMALAFIPSQEND